MMKAFPTHQRMGHWARFMTGTVLLAAPAVAQAPEDAFEEVVESITIDEIQEHVNFLAGPTTRGRGTLTPGFEVAAQYVEAQLKTLGLEAAGPNDSYRLPIELKCVGPSERSYFEIGTKKGEKEKLKVAIDFIPVPGSGNEAIEGEPVFVGFAIDARKEKWEDLSPRKVKDKVVFAFTR